MPKIVVSDRLADTLKLIRTQNGVKSKDLAEHIGKTPGYISKLEKQEIKNIELETVESIFEFILGDSYKSTEIWEKIYASLQVKYTKAEIDEEIWFTNFDTVHRHIPVPESIIRLINDMMKCLNVSRNELLARINSNEALSEEEKNDSSIKSNLWYRSIDGRGSSIKISMTNTMLDAILEKRQLSVPYVYIFCILYYLLKIETYGDIVEIDENATKAIFSKTTAILNTHKFYSIVERERIIRESQSEEEIRELLSSFDNDNAKLTEKIFKELKIASELDVRTTNERLSGFFENLDEDVWFTLKIISLNYHELKFVEISKRKEFIRDIERLIEKYANSQINIKNTETY